MSLEAVSDAKSNVYYEKHKENGSVKYQNNRKNEKNEKTAEKTVVVTTATLNAANEKKIETTDVQDIKHVRDIKEINTENEELKSRCDAHAAKIEELKKELELLQVENKKIAEQSKEAQEFLKIENQKLVDKVKAAQDDVNIAVAELNAYKDQNQDLTSSSIASTSVRKNVGSLKDDVNALTDKIDADVKIVDELLKGKQIGEKETFLKQLRDKLESFKNKQTEYQTQYSQMEANFRNLIGQGNSASNHYNSNKIMLSASEQKQKFLSLINTYYEDLFGLNEWVKQLQNDFDKLAKNDYRNETEFTNLMQSVKLSTPEEQISEAKAKYKKKDELTKKEWLECDHKKLESSLAEIKETVSKLNSKENSKMKALFETIDFEIHNSTKELDKNALDQFVTYAPSVKTSLEETLQKNAKATKELYVNFRNWVAPLWNETQNIIKKLEAESKLLKDRSILHQLQHSFNQINGLKGESKSSKEELPELTTLYNTEFAALRSAHVRYYSIIDSCEESIATLKKQIIDTKGENALLEDLKDYYINEHTNKKDVTTALIDTLNQKLEMFTTQKKSIEDKWSSLLQRIYDTSTDLYNLSTSGTWAVPVTVANLKGSNPYVAIYNELSQKPVKPKEPIATTKS